MRKIPISPFHITKYAPSRALTSRERKRLDDMRKGRCDWTVDRRLQEMRAALTGIILDDLRLRRKLINLGVDVAPAPPPITQFACREPLAAQADFDDDHDDLTAGAMRRPVSCERGRWLGPARLPSPPGRTRRKEPTACASGSGRK